MSMIASYFNKADRKKLFFDYLKLIGILEIVIFIVVVLWASDDKYHRVQTAFPWREYVFVAFAFPIVVTFLMGVIVTGFNHFLGEPEAQIGESEASGSQMEAVIVQLKRLPYLAILFLLLVTVLALYMMFFLFFKYRLNQRHLQYQYYTNISERHGLIILDDRTVLHKNGSILVQG